MVRFEACHYPVEAVHEVGGGGGGGGGSGLDGLRGLPAVEDDALSC